MDGKVLILTTSSIGLIIGSLIGNFLPSYSNYITIIGCITGFSIGAVIADVTNLITIFNKNRPDNNEYLNNLNRINYHHELKKYFVGLRKDIPSYPHLDVPIFY